MRRPRNKLLGLLAAAGCLLAAFAASVVVPVTGELELTPANLPADAHTSARLVWTKSSLYGQAIPYWPWTVRARVVEGADRIRLVGASEQEPGPAHFEIGIQAIGQVGPVTLELDTGWTRSSHRITVGPAAEDSDADGIPDVAELVEQRDRRAFRDWFVAIALAQFYAADPRWQPIHRDCAGLARFAYKEALRRHDRAWFARTPYLHRVPGDDVHRFHFPQVPRIGERVFRTQAGPFDPQADPALAFGPTANARALWEFNTVFVTLEPEAAQTGDLLFFRETLQDPDAMHAMILVDPPESAAGRRVVYHTGAAAEGPGEVRLVQLADLNAHRDDRWHVRADNPNFLGFYRWKILEGGRP